MRIDQHVTVAIAITSLALGALAILGCDPGKGRQEGWIAEPPAVLDDEHVQPPVPLAPPSEPTPLVATTLTEHDELPNTLTADARSLYWTTQGGALYRVAKAGGSAVMLAQDPRAPTDLLVVDGFVYWSVLDDSGDGALLRVSSSGGAVATVAGGPIVEVSADETNLYWIIEDQTSGATTVMMADTGGGQAAELVTIVPEPGDELRVTVGPDAVYWLVSQSFGDERGVTLHRMPKRGGQASAIAFSSLYGVLPGSLRADGRQVAWQDWGYRLRRVAIDDGEVVDIDNRTSFRAFAFEPTGVLAVKLYEPGILRYAEGAESPEVAYPTATDASLLVVEEREVSWAEWSTECTEERFEGKSAYCVAYRFEVQLIRAAR